MRSEMLLQTTGLSAAKAHLSDLMSEVVQRQHPVVVNRHKGKETMFLFAPEHMAPLLAHFRFDPQVSFDAGEWTILSPELNLTAGGESFDKALDDLVSAVEEYARDFFDRQAFYAHTDRMSHLPWLLRVALTEPEARRGLFTEPPDNVASSPSHAAVPA